MSRVDLYPQLAEFIADRLGEIDQMLDWARGAVKIAADYTTEHLEMLAPFGSHDSNHLSIVREDGAMDLYDGDLRAIGPQGDLTPEASRMLAIFGAAGVLWVTEAIPLAATSISVISRSLPIRWGCFFKKWRE